MKSIVVKHGKELVFLILLALVAMLVLTGCCKEEDVSPSEKIGETKVDLNANSTELRKKEALLGNLISDAFLEDAVDRGASPDFAVMNGGGIRFNRETLPDGIYKAGAISKSDVENMLPFGNSSVLVVVTGSQLKEIFERSVSEVERSRGQFLQVSKGMIVTFDLTKQAQVLDQTKDPAIISTPGMRIVSIKINGVEIGDDTEYRGVFPDFLVEGNDGYVTFLKVEASKKKPLDVLLLDQLEKYIVDNSPVNPVLEGRLISQ